MQKYNWSKRRPLFSSPLPTKPEKLRWRVLPIIWLALKRTCMALGAFVLFFMVLGFFILANIGAGPPPSLPREMVLYMALNGDPGEMPEPASLISEGAPGVHELVDALDRAGADKRVKGLL